VGLALLHHLDTMLDGAEKTVGVAQCLAVVRGDDIGVPQYPESPEGVARAQGRILSGEHQ